MTDRRAGGDRSDEPAPDDAGAQPTAGDAGGEAERTLRVFRAVVETSRELRNARATEMFERLTRDAEERLVRLQEIQARARAAGAQSRAHAPGARRSRVLLVDDHELAREAVRSVLGREPDLEVVGEASGGHAAIAQARRLSPDLVLMDIRMPDLDGLAATREIVAASPETRVVLLTTYDAREYVLEALRNGAAGYVLKGATKQELLATIRAVLAGGMDMHAPAARQVLHEAAAAPRPAPHDLSAREVEVLRLLARGATSKAIGLRLHLTVNTVKTHVRHILHKLDAPDRAAAVARAAPLGLLAEEEPG